MINVPRNFSGEIFAQEYGLAIDDFWIDKMRLCCPSLPDLNEDDIADCVVDVWQSIRDERYQKLTASDWTQLPDAVLTPDEQATWQGYRQALRDIPQDFDSPDDVIWPEEPNG